MISFSAISRVHYSTISGYNNAMNAKPVPLPTKPLVRVSVDALPAALAKVVSSPPAAASEPIGVSSEADGSAKFYLRHVPTTWYSIVASLLFGGMGVWMGAMMVYIFTFMDMGDGDRGLNLVLRSHSVAVLVVVILVGLLFAGLGLLCFRHIYRAIRQRSASQKGAWPYGLYVFADALLYYDWAMAKKMQCTFLPREYIGQILITEGRLSLEVGKGGTKKTAFITPPIHYYGRPQLLATELEAWKRGNAVAP